MSNRWSRLPLAIKIIPKQYTTQLCRRVENHIDSSEGKHIMAWGFEQWTSFHEEMLMDHHLSLWISFDSGLQAIKAAQGLEECEMKWDMKTSCISAVKIMLYINWFCVSMWKSACSSSLSVLERISCYRHSCRCVVKTYQKHKHEGILEERWAFFFYLTGTFHLIFSKSCQCSGTGSKV